MTPRYSSIVVREVLRSTSRAPRFCRGWGCKGWDSPRSPQQLHPAGSILSSRGAGCPASVHRRSEMSPVLSDARPLAVQAVPRYCLGAEAFNHSCRRGPTFLSPDSVSGPLAQCDGGVRGNGRHVEHWLDNVAPVRAMASSRSRRHPRHRPLNR
ncbi:hypothetical protein GWK47_011127 [Chionoecetes opilio]|uniref:Uncharacterized protein n=1 Tax=Chionoecetes opilio TaxID=41210 RepID=A0A8J4Y3Y5_CHIOP|nr:hypothetical protein GWK47_017473 [Chionoecetes opilio]KAG0715794.1 hypothetical protein GWK47_011127 [Chionoecetes opilio]